MVKKKKHLRGNFIHDYDFILRNYMSKRVLFFVRWYLIGLEGLGDQNQSWLPRGATMIHRFLKQFGQLRLATDC